MSSTARRYRPISRVVLSNPIADDAPPRVKEGAIRRRLVALTGKCPCGAELVVPDLTPGSMAVVAVEHDPDCPATEELSGVPGSRRVSE
jgi:hypothetical protein